MTQSTLDRLAAYSALSDLPAREKLSPFSKNFTPHYWPFKHDWSCVCPLLHNILDLPLEMLMLRSAELHDIIKSPTVQHYQEDKTSVLEQGRRITIN